MAFYLFKDSYTRYKVASSSDPVLAANFQQRYTRAGGYSIDNTGGLGAGRVELAIINGQVGKTTPHSSRWVSGFRYRYNSGSLGNSNIYSQQNNDVVLFRLTQNSDGTLSLWSSNATVIATTNRSLFGSTRYYLEVDVAYSGTTPIICTAELRINGHVEASGAASTGTNASQLLSNTAEANVHLLSSVTGGPGTANWITDLYYKNEAGYEGDMRNYPLFPASDGAILNWTPNAGVNHFSRVSSHPIDLTKWLSTATPGNMDLWGFDALPAFSGSVVGINISVVAQKDDEGTKSFKIVVGAAGLDAQSQEFFVSGTNAEYYEFSLKTDPTTGLAWTQAAINALRAGVLCIS